MGKDFTRKFSPIVSNELKKLLYMLLGVFCSVNAMCQPLTTDLFQKTASGFTMLRKLEYTVTRLTAPMNLDGNWNKPRWENVKALEVSNYMDQLPKFKPSMRAKLIYDNTNLYVIFQVTDSVVRCVTRDINGPVWEDNAAEFFFAPDSLSPMKYFNLEINCGGVPLMHYNAVAGKEIINLPEEEIKKIEIAHSYTPASDKERFGLLTWTLEYKIPLNMLEKYSKVSKPAKGVYWRANFYKIAHKSSDPHYASWSFVDIAPDDVQMHLPEFFGVLKFE
jgi:hypothetical protein